MDWSTEWNHLLLPMLLTWFNSHGVCPIFCSCVPGVRGHGCPVGQWDLLKLTSLQVVVYSDAIWTSVLFESLYFLSLGVTNSSFVLNYVSVRARSYLNTVLGFGNINQCLGFPYFLSYFLILLKNYLL